jgi:hypothetical protein
MESANESIDQKHFLVATKKLKMIEDAIMGPVSPDQVNNFKFSLTKVIFDLNEA